MSDATIATTVENNKTSRSNDSNHEQKADNETTKKLFCGLLEMAVKCPENHVYCNLKMRTHCMV